MIVYVDIVSGQDIATDSYPHTELLDGAIHALETKKITIGDDDINVGGNPSSEGGGEDEALEKDVKTVVNLVHSHNLQKCEFKDKKKFKAALQKYFTSVVVAYGRQEAKLLEIEEAFNAHQDELKELNAKKAKIKDEKKKAPIDAEIKASKEAYDEKAKEAYAALNKFDKKAVDDMKTKSKAFVKRGKALMEWVKDNIEANFEECEFYLPADAEFGECAIVCARYIGEAVAPVVYIFMDCVIARKE